MATHILYFDGASKGNPGRAGAGAVIYDNLTGKEIWSKALFVGDKQTNNVAEYTGLIIGLEAAIALNITALCVRGDSKLAIEQMKGAYKVGAPTLLPLYKKAKALCQQITNVTFEHVYREYNKRADALSNEALLPDLL